MNNKVNGISTDDLRRMILFERLFSMTELDNAVDTETGASSRTPADVMYYEKLSSADRADAEKEIQSALNTGRSKLTFDTSKSNPDKFNYFTTKIALMYNDPTYVAKKNNIYNSLLVAYYGSRSFIDYMIKQLSDLGLKGFFKASDPRQAMEDAIKDSILGGEGKRGKFIKGTLLTALEQYKEPISSFNNFYVHNKIYGGKFTIAIKPIVDSLSREFGITQAGEGGKKQYSSKFVASDAPLGRDDDEGDKTFGDTLTMHTDEEEKDHLIDIMAKKTWMVFYSFCEKFMNNRRGEMPAFYKAVVDYVVFKNHPQGKLYKSEEIFRLLKPQFPNITINSVYDAKFDVSEVLRKAIENGELDAEIKQKTGGNINIGLFFKTHPERFSAKNFRLEWLRHDSFIALIKEILKVSTKPSAPTAAVTAIQQPGEIPSAAGQAPSGSPEAWNLTRESAKNLLETIWQQLVGYGKEITSKDPLASRVFELSVYQNMDKSQMYNTLKGEFNLSDEASSTSGAHKASKGQVKVYKLAFNIITKIKNAVLEGLIDTRITAATGQHVGLKEIFERNPEKISIKNFTLETLRRNQFMVNANWIIMNVLRKRLEECIEKFAYINNVYDRFNKVVVLSESYQAEFTEGSSQGGQEVATMDLFEHLKEFVDESLRIISALHLELHEIYRIVDETRGEYGEAAAAIEATVSPMIDQIQLFPNKLKVMLLKVRGHYNPKRAYGTN